MTIEQIQLRVSDPADAALVDMWGRLLPLANHNEIGRAIDVGVLILHPAISRRHASLVLEGNDWVLLDLGSTHGTFVEDARIDAVAVQNGARVQFGHVRMYFLADASPLFTANTPPAKSKTLREIELKRVRARTEQEAPFVELPRVRTIVLREPTGGGGGYVEVDGVAVQLTTAQFELIGILMNRMLMDDEQPDEDRGFVSGSELAERLSLDSSIPSGDTIRQLVRRVRRAFVRAGVGDLIESRQGVGYRLRQITLTG